MRRLLLTITLLLSALVAIAQNGERETKAQISRIKLDSSYLYGDATMPTQEEAQAEALAFLLESAKEFDATLTIDQSKIKYLSHMRIDMYRSFAYICKDELNDATSERRFSPEAIAELSSRLASLKSINELKSIEDESIVIEELSLGTEELTLKNSFLILFKGRSITRMFSPVAEDMKRTDLRSGEKCDRIDYSRDEKVVYIAVGQ